MINIQHNFDLTNLNTLHLKSIANRYLKLESLSQLEQIRELIADNSKYFVLGGGSNIILPEYYDGLIIHNQLLGKKISDSDKHYLITASAGEMWDDFVAWCLDNGAYGLENLSLIPGTVGASPVQNIGAYGVEVKDFIQYITVYDLLTGEIKNILNHECNFSYRNSILKKLANLLVMSVTFELPKISPLNCDYGDIKAQIESIQNPTGHDLRNCIIKTRQSKLPNPATIGNAGSFFHNPIISKIHADKLKQKYPNLPTYPTTSLDMVKISAGWLIDNLGLKGYTLGNVGIYHKQALVLINHGGANKSELLKLAHQIQDKVSQMYNVNLNIEPICI